MNTITFSGANIQNFFFIKSSKFLDCVYCTSEPRILIEFIRHEKEFFLSFVRFVLYHRQTKPYEQQSRPIISASQ